MNIDKDLLQTMKDVPNSPYSVISPYFLFHSNKIEGSTFSESELEKLFDRKQIPKHTIALEMRRAMVVERNGLDALSTKQFEAQEASARINGSRNKLDAPGLDPR